MMNTIGRAWLLSLSVAVPLPLGAQQATVEVLPVQPRDAPRRIASPKGTAAIHGTVTSVGKPLVDAQITLNSPELGGQRTATSDDQGRFAVQQLPPGRYTITAMKPGYLNVSWGQRSPRGSGRAVYLRDGETRQLAIELPRAGVMTGTVFDERGEPLIGASVQASMIATINGQRTVRGGNGSMTDDRGVYRLHSLQPGEYVICAGMGHRSMTDRQRLQQELQMFRRMMSNPEAGLPMTAQQLTERLARLEAQLADAPAEPMRGYAPACAGALGHGIPLGASEERTAVDLHLQRVELGWIEGTIVLPPGVTPRELTAFARPARDEAPAIMNSHLAVDDMGRFTIDALVPGEYTLEVRTRVIDGAGVVLGPGARPPDRPDRQAPPRFWASADVTVDTGGTTVVVDLQPAVTISGEIVFEGAAPRPPDMTRLQVMATPIAPPTLGFRPMMMETPRGTPDADGRFTLRGVFPGSYRVFANLQGWHVKSAMLGDRDVLDFPLDVKGGHVTGVTVTLTDRPAELLATLVDAKGQPAMDHTLLLFAADDRYWTPGSRRVRVARANPDGTFTFRGTPTGEYRVAALLDVDLGDLGSREFLEQLAWSSTRVRLADGETTRVALRVDDQ